MKEEENQNLLQLQAERERTIVDWKWVQKKMKKHKIKNVTTIAKATKIWDSSFTNAKKGNPFASTSQSAIFYFFKSLENENDKQDE